MQVLFYLEERLPQFNQQTLEGQKKQILWEFFPNVKFSKQVAEIIITSARLQAINQEDTQIIESLDADKFEKLTFFCQLREYVPAYAPLKRVFIALFNTCLKRFGRLFIPLQPLMGTVRNRFFKNQNISDDVQVFLVFWMVNFLVFKGIKTNSILDVNDINYTIQTSPLKMWLQSYQFFLPEEAEIISMSQGGNFVIDYSEVQILDVLQLFQSEDTLLLNPIATINKLLKKEQIKDLQTLLTDNEALYNNLLGILDQMVNLDEQPQYRDKTKLSLLFSILLGNDLSDEYNEAMAYGNSTVIIGQFQDNIGSYVDYLKNCLKNIKKVIEIFIAKVQQEFNVPQINQLLRKTTWEIYQERLKNTITHRLNNAKYLLILPRGQALEPEGSVVGFSEVQDIEDDVVVITPQQGVAQEQGSIKVTSFDVIKALKKFEEIMNVPVEQRPGIPLKQWVNIVGYGVLAVSAVVVGYLYYKERKKYGGGYIYSYE